MTTYYIYNHRAYTLIQNIVASEKIMYQAYTCLGDHKKARESFHKVLDGESTLSIIRLQLLREKQFDQIPDLF